MLTNIELSKKYLKKLNNALKHETKQCNTCIVRCCKRCAMFEQKKAIRFRIERKQLKIENDEIKDVLNELVNIVQGIIDCPDEVKDLDGFTLQPARQVLKKDK